MSHMSGSIHHKHLFHSFIRRVATPTCNPGRHNRGRLCCSHSWPEVVALCSETDLERMYCENSFSKITPTSWYIKTVTSSFPNLMNHTQHIREEREHSQAFALFTLLPLVKLRCKMTVRLSHPKWTKPSNEAKHNVSPWQCLCKTGLHVWPNISSWLSKHHLLMACKNQSKGGSTQEQTVSNWTSYYSGSELEMRSGEVPSQSLELIWLNVAQTFSQSKD